MTPTPNTVASHVLVGFACEAGGAAMQDHVVEALFAACFTGGADIGDQGVLAATACGRDRTRVDAVLADSSGSAAIVLKDAELRRQSFGGLPFFVLDGCFLFSGAQPAAAMVDSLRTATAQVRAMQGHAAAD